MSSDNWWVDNYGEYHCGPCQEEFEDWDDLRDHYNADYYHEICQRCNELCSDSQDLRNHVANSSNHHICWICNYDYEDGEDYQRHFPQEHFGCQLCDDWFANDREREQHKIDRHFYCSTHRQSFNNQFNLNAHYASSAHIAANIACPAQGCSRHFINYGAVTLHLEAGTCASGMNRQRLDNTVATWDTRGLITNSSQRLIAGPSPQSSHSSMLATSASYNHQARQYECFFCHKFFRTLGGLNQHLSSPRHAFETHQTLQGHKMYHCPSQHCPREFLSLSGLVQHVESGSCGARQFHGVANAIQNAVGGGGRKRMSPY